ncbi:MAG: hypothetical protein U5J78_05730 [Parasphingorhabdus sp.]|nr:hypothetical protein [Parasphingorhabdus sp.]
MLLIVLPPHYRGNAIVPLLAQLDQAAPNRVWLAASMNRAGSDARSLRCTRRWPMRSLASR